MGTIRTKVSRSHSEIRAFLSLTFCSPNQTYDMRVAQLYINTSVKNKPLCLTVVVRQVSGRTLSNEEEVAIGELLRVASV